MPVKTYRQLKKQIAGETRSRQETEAKLVEAMDRAATAERRERDVSRENADLRARNAELMAELNSLKP